MDSNEKFGSGGGADGSGKGKALVEDAG